jgi:CheY-like chemotaxis protein
MGIPVEKQTELFKPFARLGRESGEIEGTGIGLTITRQIIELLGGQVNYESGDKGSCFWVDIPTGDKLDGFEGENRAMEKPALIPEGKAEGGIVRTILYVEDNPDNMRLMETIISRLTNTKMLTAYNIELGIDLARSYNPELILMDLDLPGMNGIEALRQLQDTVQTKNIPVFAITAAAMPKDIEAGLEGGFREYITRPIDIPNILRVIEETIDSTKSVA